MNRYTSQKKKCPAIIRENIELASVIKKGSNDSVSNKIKVTNNQRIILAKSKIGINLYKDRKKLLVTDLLSMKKEVLPLIVK